MALTMNQSLSGVMTAGRMGFFETFRCMLRTMGAYGIPTYTRSGGFWYIAITGSIKDALVCEYTHPDYILFYDGDSLFDHTDINAMWERMQDDDSIDAIFPVQADRNGPSPLAAQWNVDVGDDIKQYVNFDCDMSKVIHGHFGCTIIRRKVFEEMPHPWFMSIPGRNGSWETADGKIDADSYFWIKAFDMGFKAVQANDIVIGHMELMGRWQKGDEVICQTLYDWQANGKPEWTRGPNNDELEGLRRTQVKPEELNKKSLAMGMGE